MRTFNMDMSSYEIEHIEPVASDYSDEVMYAGWIPNLACQQLCTERQTLPVTLARMDMDIFLNKMYSCQR